MIRTMRMIAITFLAWGAFTAAQMLLAQGAPAAVPDAVYHNGKIITVDPAFSIREAFAVTGDQFSAVGSNAEVRALAGPQTKLIDLRGRAVIPGLMDNHNHAYKAALVLRGVDLRGVRSLAEMLKRIKAGDAGTPAGKVLYAGIGWDPADFPEKRPPTLRELDEAAPNHPLVAYLYRGRAYVNSASLKTLGFTPEKNTIKGVTIKKDNSGELTSEMSGRPSAALIDMTVGMSPPSPAELKDLLVSVQKQQLGLGLTSIRELSLPIEVMRAYYELWREKRLVMRVSMGLEVATPEAEHMEKILAPWGVGPAFGDHWLRLDAVAEINPGDLFRKPPSEATENRLQISAEKFRLAMQIVNRYGWRPSIHTGLDGTLDTVLDAYEAADRESSIRGKRWIVEHIPLVHPDQMERIKRLDVLVSAQIQPYIDAANMTKSWGKENAERAVPMRELLDHGLLVAGGSDWPPYNTPRGPSNNPSVNIYFFVTRNTLDLGAFGVAQKISRAEALRVMTVNNAHLTYEEKVKGSIEPGKLADFLILSHDILTVPEEQIRSILPLATYVGGQKAFSSPQGGF